MRSILFALIYSIGFSAHAAETQVIKIDGSSTVFPITEAVAEEFQTTKKGEVKVTVGISGTGGGFKKFCRGETDLQDASRPIKGPEEMESCKTAGIKYMELPVAFDAIAIVVPKTNTWLKEITIEELKKMWEPASQTTVMTWADVNPKWPKQPMKLYGPGADSGTFDYFTEVTVGKAKASRGDYTASEDDNVIVKGVANDKNALGYFGMAYAEENKKSLRVVPVVGKSGKAITPTKVTVENGTYAPLSRPIFIYVSEASYRRPEVKEFVEFYMKNGARLVESVKYVALPAEAYRLGLEHAQKGKLGTAYAGHVEPGMKVQDILKKEKSL